MQIDGLDKLLGFKGFIIDKITFSPDIVQYHLHRDRRRKMVCPNCCRNMSFNKSITRTVSDLPIGTARCVKITFDTQQGKCSCGHTKTFLPDEVDEKATATKRLKIYASELCRYMTASEVSHLLPFSDDTIRRWDKEVLEKQLGKVDLSKVQRLLIDEKSIGKHHKYITLVLDAETGELLYLGKGKSSASLSPFFEKMPENIRQNIVIACMDRTAAYKGVVQKFCPNAVIVYDKFHIVKNLNEAVDQVRREETKKVEKEKTPMIKGERYAILWSRENLKPEQRVSLQTLLKLNEHNNAAYMSLQKKENFYNGRLSNAFFFHQYDANPSCDFTWGGGCSLSRLQLYVRKQHIRRQQADVERKHWRFRPYRFQRRVSRKDSRVFNRTRRRRSDHASCYQSARRKQHFSRLRHGIEFHQPRRREIVSKP